MIKKLLFLTSLLLMSLVASAGLFNNNQPQYLPADQAFVLNAQYSENQVQLHWQIAEDYYLYQERLEFSLNHGKNTLNKPKITQPPKSYDDPYFGKVNIFKEQLDIQLTRMDDKDWEADDILEVTYQGCTHGFCYPPETKQFKLSELPQADLSLSSQQTEPSAVQNSKILSPQQDQLAEGLSQNKLSVFWFFLLGAGLAFTPCVLPMLPLLSAVVIGGERKNNWRALALSFVYVQGMALTYTLLGLIVALIGLPFQIALQSPPVLIGLSILFVLLALSMFGLFTIQLPNSWQNKLSAYSQQQKSGAFWGVFMMGALAGLVASPCTSAPLSGALLYVAQSGDVALGTLTLYLLALGMGTPLILITVFGNKILPKSGAWLENVKTAFGFVMLALPIFLLSRLIDDVWGWRLWAVWGISFALWLATKMHRHGIGLAFRIFFIGVAIVLAQPLQAWLWQGTNSFAPLTQSAVQNKKIFQRITSMAELNQILAMNNKIVMLDLYADWCVACKEFEHITFADEKVRSEFEKILLLQIDMTKNTDENQRILKSLSVIGLPTIIFFNAQGEEIKNSRITGFLEPEPFLSHLQSVQNAQ